MADATAPEASAPGAFANRFWAFSLTLYARPRIAAACLRLQDAHGLDVNLLLLCSFLARSGCGRLSKAALAAAEARVAPWRAGVLMPLREARRALKTMNSAGVPAFYAKVKGIELDAEREAQRLLLASWLAPTAASSDPMSDEAANLALYCAAQGLPSETADELIYALRSID